MSIVSRGLDEGVHVARLRRGVFARIRFCGVVELASYIGVLTIVLVLNDYREGHPENWGGAGGVVFAAVVWGAAIAIRVSVATEYLEASPTGLRWRWLFRTWNVPWTEVAELKTTRIYLVPARSMDDVIEVRCSDGRRFRLRPSVWCKGYWDPWFRSAARFWAASSA